MPLTPASAVSSAVFNQGNGAYYAAALQDKVFMGSTLIAGVALPVMAATLASKFTLWNPAGSGVVAEPIEFAVGMDSATTVVNAIGFAMLFNVSQLSTGLPTAPTFAAGAAQTNAAIGNGGISTSGKAAPKCGLYSALTLTNAAVFGPTIWMTSFGAVTDGSLGPAPYLFNGKFLLPPDSLLTFVTSVIVETAMAASLLWAEW
jgi:hypothetical protein